ncbi:MAG: hypothetical protein GY950_22215 [bacterium]|nr:hypothetical protein [bacterium]
MEEKVYEVEMMYIQNTSGTNYSVEMTGRRCKNMKLNFSNVEGIEFNPQRALEIKSSYIQMSEGQSKIWNIKFAYPTNFGVKFIVGKIIIDVI